MMLPVYFELNPGESFTHCFGGTTPRTVKLLHVSTTTEPLYQHGVWFDVFKDARIDLLIDEKPLQIVCAPYQLPTAFEGLVIEADLVPESAGGLHTIELTKAARFAALCEERPWMIEDFNLHSAAISSAQIGMKISTLRQDGDYWHVPRLPLCGERHAVLI